MRKLNDEILAALKVIADESSAVAAVIDTKDDYRIIWTNKRLRQFLGFSVEGMRWGGRCPFAFGINAIEAMDRVVETGEPFRAEERPFSARVSSRFGETTYWNWKVLPLKSEGRPGCVLVLAENVTDHVARKAAERRRDMLFGGVVLDLPVGVATIDPAEFRLTDANDIFLSYLLPEYQTRDSIGKPMRDIMPNFEESGLADILNSVVSTREIFAAHEYEVKDPDRGSTWWNLTVRLISLESGMENLLVTVWDVSEQVNAKRRLETSRRRAQTMIKVQQAISASLTLEEVLNIISQSAKDLMNSAAASVFMLSEDGKTFIPKGASGIDLIGTCSVELGRERSLAERAVQDRRPVTLAGEDVVELSCLPVLQTGRQIAAIAAAPVEVEGRIIGVIEVYNDESRRYTNDELDVLDTLANASAIAIVNAELFEEAENSRRELETRNRTIETERKLLLAILDSIPDAVAVTDTSYHIVHANEAARQLFSPDEEGVVSLIDLVARAKPRTIDGKDIPLDEQPMAKVIRGEDVRNYELMFEEINGRTHYRSVSGGPVRDQQGNIIFGVTVGRDITTQKELQADLEKAYEREKRIAQTLQQALLSPVPEKIDSVEMAVVYEAGLREAEIGGDFFDVFWPSPGKMAIVIGDVAGKGLTAAIQIAAVKYGIRGFAYEDPSPSSVAARVNDFLVRERTVGGFVSVFYGLVDIDSGRLLFANAGHEPPLLRRKDGQVERLLSDGIVMGVNAGYIYNEVTVSLERGDRLLLYTDGITEARKDSGEMLGEDRLIGFWAGECGDGAKTALNAVYEWAKDFSEGHFHDDVALVVISTEGESGE